jgi:hypothetical protein
MNGSTHLATQYMAPRWSAKTTVAREVYKYLAATEPEHYLVAASLREIQVTCRCLARCFKFLSRRPSSERP